MEHGSGGCGATSSACGWFPSHPCVAHLALHKRWPPECLFGCTLPLGHQALVVATCCGGRVVGLPGCGGCPLTLADALRSKCASGRNAETLCRCRYVACLVSEAAALHESCGGSATRAPHCKAGNSCPHGMCHSLPPCVAQARQPDTCQGAIVPRLRPCVRSASKHVNDVSAV